MIIIKTKTGVTYVNERKTQVIQWMKDQKMVVIRSDPKGLNCNIYEVVTVRYMSNRKKKSEKENEHE